MSSAGLFRQVLTALLVQGAGGLATLLAALWIGHALGPVQQGQFNQLKSLIELGVAGAALGMPQALYVWVQQGKLGLGSGLRLSLAPGLLGLCLGAVLALGFWSGGGAGLVLALALAVGLGCLHTQWRALALLLPDTWPFNLVTAAPQWLLLPLAGALVLAGGSPAAPVAWAMAAVWAVGTAVAVWALLRLHGPRTDGAAAPVREASGMGKGADRATAWARGPVADRHAVSGLLRHGLSTWATATLATLGVVLLQHAAQRFDAHAGAGPISLALLLAQVPLTPLNYVLPLLLRHRLQRDAGRARRRAPVAALVLALLTLALGVAVAGQWRSDLGLGPGYLGLHSLLACLLVATAAEAVLRLLAVDAQAEGRPWPCAVAEGLRMLVLLASLAGLHAWPQAQPVRWLAVAWLLGTLAALAWLGWQRRPGRDAAATSGAAGHRHIALLGQANSIHLMRWAAGLRQHGCRVTVLSQQVDEALPLPQGVDFQPLPWRGAAGYFLNAWALRRWLRRHQPDLLHAHYASGYGTTAWLAQWQPTLLSVWGSDVYAFPYQAAWKRWLLGRNLRHAQALGATSQAMADQVRRLWPQAGAIALTPFGVDRQRFAPASTAPAPPPADAAPVLTLGTIKTLAPAYGIDILLRGFALLRARRPQQPLRLLLVGDGPQRAELQALAQTLGLADAVQWAGAVPHAEVPAWLRRLDVYVAVSRHESFGVAVVEAMACGVPVVVSDVGGLPEVVDHGRCGCVVPAESPEALAEALAQLLHDAPRRAALQQAALRRVQQVYDWDICVRTMLAWYEQRLAQAPLQRR